MSRLIQRTVFNHLDYTHFTEVILTTIQASASYLSEATREIILNQIKMLLVWALSQITYKTNNQRIVRTPSDPRQLQGKSLEVL